MAPAGDVRACLISNEAAPPEAIVDTHILAPYDTDVTKTESVERFLGLSASSFNSPSNFIPLRLDLQASYKAGRWALVPARPNFLLNLVVKTLREMERPNIQSLSQTIIFEGKECTMYDCCFAFFTQDTIVSRVNRIEGTSHPRHMNQFRYPYDNFPIIRITAHPYFVIQCAYDVLRLHLTKLTPRMAELYSHIHTLVSLWRTLEAPLGDKTEPLVKTESTQEDVDSLDLVGGPSRKRPRMDDI